MKKEDDEVKECTFWPKVNNPTVTKLKNKLIKSQAKQNLNSWTHNFNVIGDRIKEKILKDLASNTKTTNGRYGDSNCEIEELKEFDDPKHKIVDGFVEHNISVVTNSELDEYLKHKNRPSDVSEQQKESLHLNISPKSGFESGTFEKPQSTIEGTDANEAPILFLDVNFGDDKLTRIVMYKGNGINFTSLDDSPRELAKAFWQEHNLSDAKQIKLVKIIQHHLKGVLDKIVEEESEEA